MFNIGELHRASIIMDVAAVFIIIGIIVYTSIYRRRGRTQDKMYFLVSLVCGVMALSDAVTYILDGSTVPYATQISLFCNDIFFISFEWFCGMIVVYLAYRYRCDMKHIGERLTNLSVLLMSLPTAVTTILIIANHYTMFLYGVDPATNMYFQSEYYILLYIAPLIYAVMSLIYIILLDRKVVWLFVTLILCRLLLGYFMRGVSSTAIMFVIGLVFVHIHVMQVPFYEIEYSDNRSKGGTGK